MCMLLHPLTARAYSDCVRTLSHAQFQLAATSRPILVRQQTSVCKCVCDVDFIAFLVVSHCRLNPLPLRCWERKQYNYLQLCHWSDKLSWLVNTYNGFNAMTAPQTLFHYYYYTISSSNCSCSSNSSRQTEVISKTLEKPDEYWLLALLQLLIIRNYSQRFFRVN